MPLTVHVINHTHWDREWFLTHIYTNALIPGLIDRLDRLVAQNPNFQYLLDGQTLIIEDLLNLAPQYLPKVARLIRQGNLIIGPYYCQPDWKLTCGEALLRNLIYGQVDVARYGAVRGTGWLVDTFGHISQTPQMHRLFGIPAVYVWRGVPLLEPYFHWHSPDGSRVLTINLFGGYRNLYGVTQAPELAVQRLETEARRLQPYYPTPDIPLFDGYDLEDDPEDPVRFFQEQAGVPSGLSLRDSTPEKFSRIPAEIPDLPDIQGELNSGKYGATFPGTLSARTYLKIMAHDCERLLYRVCEPLAALASLCGRPYPAEPFQRWGRALLRNSIHDCLCGVSIDLVHEKMEYTYGQIFQGLESELADILAHLLGGFQPGCYAVSTNPYPYEGWQVARERLALVKTDGVGIWPIRESKPVEAPDRPVASFTWRNRHYTAAVQGNGAVQVGAATLGTLAVSREMGDAYSDVRGDFLERLHPEEMVVEQRSDRHCVLRLAFSRSWGEISVAATVRLTFDRSPLIRWSVDLDSRGTDFRVEMVFDCGHTGQIYVGMPFDVVPRSPSDDDLLPRLLPPALAGVLLGQREVGAVSSFPFHDFVAVSNEQVTSGVFARGLRSYQAEDNGRVTIPLRRAVEWLTRADLAIRVGDAGPFFYVPDARCERAVRHELAFASGPFGVLDVRFQALNAAFQNPPVLVRSHGNGGQTTWQFFQENLPLNSLYRSGESILARLHNPGWEAHTLRQPYRATDIWGAEQGPILSVSAKRIVTLALNSALRGEGAPGPSSIEILNPPTWRVGPNQGSPDPAVIDRLRQKAADLEVRLDEIERETRQAHGRGRRRREHEYYVLRREMYEYLLSARLNELKRQMGGKWTQEYLFQQNDEIMAIGLELNRMRIMRRIFDYVVQAS